MTNPLVAELRRSLLASFPHHIKIDLVTLQVTMIGTVAVMAILNMAGLMVVTECKGERNAIGLHQTIITRMIMVRTLFEATQAC